jgi:hypothetical protein
MLVFTSKSISADDNKRRLVLEVSNKSLRTYILKKYATHGRFVEGAFVIDGWDVG